MAGGGYIKLYRAVRGTAIADNPVYFAAWVHLLLMATHTDHDQVVGRQIVHLKPGQLVFGRDKFSASTGISVNQLRAALTIMKTLGMVTIKPNAKYSLISITNWSEYQHQPPADNQQIASSSPADSHKQEGSKNGKNGKNNNNQPDKPAGVLPDEVVKIFNETLGHVLPKVKVMTKARKSAITARIKENQKRNNVGWWIQYFEAVGSSDFLTGQGPARLNGIPWSAKFDWLINQNNLTKVIEGNYGTD